jgi:hypothetical protein
MKLETESVIQLFTEIIHYTDDEGKNENSRYMKEEWNLNSIKW